MTEVPEHLLKRSRDRRAALGLGGDGGDGGDATPAEAAPTPAPSTGIQPAAATAAAPVAAATPAEVEPPKPPPLYVQAALKRKKIPLWVMPVLVFLPVWAILYLGGLSKASTGEPTQIELGGEIFSAQCATCHGSAGGGGVGRPLNNGDLMATFPDLIGQLDFVYLGSAGTGPAGTPYGDPNREGGQHTTQSYNGNQMPAFGKSLTGAQLLAVVRYERETISGAEIAPEQLDAEGNMLWPNGNKMLDATGNLIDPEGQPLIDASTGKLTIEPNWTDPVAGSG